MRSFKQIYQKRDFQVSFEIFPPKTEKGRKNLLEELKTLKEYHPAYFSVTYGAMGSTRDLTADLACEIYSETEVPTAFHFTCVGSNKSEIKDYIHHLGQQGLNLVVSLRGDDPDHNQEFTVHEEGFSYANELVEYLDTLGDLSQAVAGYPEGHIESHHLDDDMKYLKLKVDAGADIIITQLFFDNKYFYDFVDRARKIGIQIPIIPGIMPIINLAQIERITQMCGATIPEDLYRKLNEVREDPEQVREIGIKHAINQCLDLQKNYGIGIHFYMLNKSKNVIPILDSLL